jgi:hypothetical protein
MTMQAARRSGTRPADRRHLFSDSARLLKKSVLGQGERRRTLEKRREELRSRSPLARYADRRGLKSKGRNKADENHEKIDAVSTGVSARACAMRTNRYIRIRLIARGEKLDDWIGVSSRIVYAGLDARKRCETDGYHRHPDPRALRPIPRH